MHTASISVSRTKRARLAFKAKCVAYKGGKCSCCGYNKSIAAMDFHHVNPNEKEFTVGGRGVTLFSEVVKLELDKCILLCSNCHRELHSAQEAKMA